MVNRCRVLEVKALRNDGGKVGLEPQFGGNVEGWDSARGWELPPGASGRLVQGLQDPSDFDFGAQITPDST
jgi:hypothetical protein